MSNIRGCSLVPDNFISKVGRFNRIILLILLLFAVVQAVCAVVWPVVNGVQHTKVRIFSVNNECRSFRLRIFYTLYNI